MKRSFAAAVSTLVLATVPATAAFGQEALEITTEEVAEGIYMLAGRGGNIGLAVGPSATFLIDDQYAPATEAILEAVAAVTDRPIDFVLNTHWHGDHTGGNENLGQAGVWIVGHENVREKMSAPQYIETFDMRTDAAPEVAKPALTFRESMTFHLDGRTIRILHLEGSAHTDGDSIVHFVEDNVVHLGDTMFAGMYPFIDVGTGGTLAGMIRHADAVLGMIDDETRIIPGHGPLSTKADLVAYRALMQELHDAISPLVAAGKSREEVIAAKPTAPWDEEWTSFLPPDAVVAFLYDSIVSEREAAAGE